MADLYHWWGNDLKLNCEGDLATLDGSGRTQQRIVRRLCTNGKNAPRQIVGEYIFHSDYGAGLPRYVGEPANQTPIVGLVRSQMYQEAGVLHGPEQEPVISPRQDLIGELFMNIKYFDADDENERTLSFSVTA